MTLFDSMVTIRERYVNPSQQYDDGIRILDNNKKAVCELLKTIN
jgi:hypothetical protein